MGLGQVALQVARGGSLAARSRRIAAMIAACVCVFYVKDLGRASDDCHSSVELHRSYTYDTYDRATKPRSQHSYSRFRFCFADGRTK